MIQAFFPFVIVVSLPILNRFQNHFFIFDTVDPVIQVNLQRQQRTFLLYCFNNFELTFTWFMFMIFQFLRRRRILGSKLNPACIYLFKVNSRRTRAICGICSKLAIKPPENVFDVVLVSLLLNLNKFYTSL